jgi:hypothetical protein
MFFNGDMHIGRRRFRTAAVATVWLGVADKLFVSHAVATVRLDVSP